MRDLQALKKLPLLKYEELLKTHLEEQAEPIS